MLTPVERGEGAEILSCMLNHYHQRQQLGWVAATGDAAGRLRFHTPNGTLVKVSIELRRRQSTIHDRPPIRIRTNIILTTNQSTNQSTNGQELDTGLPVRGLVRHGIKHLAITAGPDVRFLSPATLQEPAQGGFVCLGRHGPLTSLAVDPAVPFILYAGTADGDVLAFDSRVTAAGAAGAVAGAGAGAGHGKEPKPLALAFKLGHPRHGGERSKQSVHPLKEQILTSRDSFLSSLRPSFILFGLRPPRPRRAHGHPGVPPGGHGLGALCLQHHRPPL